METFKYETHLHTSQASACGSSLAQEYIKTYIDAGYSGIFVTDHFFGGNTAVPKDLPWKERIDIYCSGYEAALEESKKYKNFSVFFGIEQTYNGDDYLIYGLNKEWLYNHPEIETMSHRELFEAVSFAGGLMIQAHPFRLRDYIKAIHLHPRECHGVEIYNAGNYPEENELAALYAKQYDLPVTSGSDIHNISCVPFMPKGLHIGGMEFTTPLTSVNDYVQRIKNKEGQPIK